MDDVSVLAAARWLVRDVGVEVTPREAETLPELAGVVPAGTATEVDRPHDPRETRPPSRSEP